MNNQKLQVTILKNIHTNNSDRVIPFADYIESIKDGSIDALTGINVTAMTAAAMQAYAADIAAGIDPKAGSKYPAVKTKLPVITAGDASEGVDMEKIKSCGLHIADLDGTWKAPFTATDKAALRQALLALPFIAVSESASGNGFALYWLSDLTDDDKPDYKSLQESFFSYINQFVLQLPINTPALRHLGLCLDAGAKDVFSRRRFISAAPDVAVKDEDVCPLTKELVKATAITACIGNKNDTERAYKVLFETDAAGQLKYPPATQGAGGQPAQTAAIRALRRAGFSKAMARGYYLLLYNPTCVPPFTEQDKEPDSKRFDRLWEYVNKDKPYAPPCKVLPSVIDELQAVDDINTIPYTPFPVDCLPKTVRDFVTDTCRVIGLKETSSVATVALATIGGVIGASCRIVIKKGHTEPAHLYTAIVGESGNGKSPAIKSCTSFLDDKQSRAFDDYTATMKVYEEKMRAYKNRRNKKGSDGTPEPIEPPPCKRFVIADATLEAVAKVLNENPLGLCLIQDELQAFFGGMDAYRKNATDLQHWIKIFSGQPVVIDKVTKGTLYIATPSVSIIDGIQPAVLRKTLGRVDSNLDRFFAKIIIRYELDRNRIR